MPSTPAHPFEVTDLPRRLHSFEAGPAEERRSYRLYGQGRALGLAKGMGLHYFYSRDGGFSWTGKKITAQRWALASDLRDHKNRRLFCGDQVLLRSSRGEQRRTVLVDNHRQSWLYHPRARQLESVDLAKARALSSKLVLLPPGREPKASFYAQVERALGSLELSREADTRDLLLFSATIVGSAVLLGLLLWTIQGGIGFFAPFLCAFAASWGVHRLEIARRKKMLSRSAMLGLSHRVALSGGTLLSVIFACSRGYLIHNPTQLSSVWVYLIVWIASTAACGVCMLLSGDIATWQCGGYPGEGAGPSASSAV